LHWHLALEKRNKLHRLRIWWFLPRIRIHGRFFINSRSCLLDLRWAISNMDTT
jgi:hypothetical protein